MKLTTLHDLIAAALVEQGDIPVIIEVIDHGSIEQLRPSTIMLEVDDETLKATEFVIQCRTNTE